LEVWSWAVTGDGRYRGRRETGDGRRETGDGRRETGDGRRERVSTGRDLSDVVAKEVAMWVMIVKDKRLVSSERWSRWLQTFGGVDDWKSGSGGRRETGDGRQETGDGRGETGDGRWERSRAPRVLLRALKPRAARPTPRLLDRPPERKQMHVELLMSRVRLVLLIARPSARVENGEGRGWRGDREREWRMIETGNAMDEVRGHAGMNVGRGWVERTAIDAAAGDSAGAASTPDPRPSTWR
jgi:hypothetical protein